MVQDFGHAVLGRLNTPVFRLGLSASYRPGRNAIYRALEAGVNYLFCFGFDTQMIDVVRDQVNRQRERYVIATGAYNYIVGRQDLRRTLEKRLCQLRTDYIDVFHLLGVLRPGECSDAVIEELQQLREEGLVRSIGISSHDRRLAGKLAASGALDVVMVRYNAAHTGAEQEVFPRVDPRVGVIGYTATKWGRLLRRPRGWPEGVPSPNAGLCYRFVLSHPSVDVCLMAPSNERQMEENLGCVEQGPLWPEEQEFMRHLGRWVHDQKRWTPFTKPAIQSGSTIRDYACSQNLPIGNGADHLRPSQVPSRVSAD